MNKYIFRNVAVFIIMLFIISVATISVSSAVTYTNSKGTVTVKCGKYKKKFTAKKYGRNFSRALNEALETARKKGKASKIAKVTISKGNYTLDRTIKIYSNTTLVAKGCRIRYYGNLLRNGYAKHAYAATGYSGAKNITINGGTWDALVPYSQAGTSNWRIQHSTMRFAHCKNVTIKNCNFVGNYNCHDIEFGAVKDSKIYKCSFSNTKNVNNFKNDGGREAIQFDVATYEAMPEFVYYDKTPTKNITVSYCSFKNKYRGIGSHHAVPGKLFSNISVHDNTFNNIGGIAIYGVYWTDSKIYSNTMTNVGLGVDIRSMTIGSGYNFRNMNKLSYEQCEAKVKKSKLYIYNNTIKLRVKDNNYVRPTGIRVMGEHYDKYDLETGIQPGTYKVYNVNVGVNPYGTVKPNKITGNVSVGVQLNYAVNSTVVGNSVNLSSSVQDEANGIEIKGCDNTTVEGNTLKNGTYKSGIGVLLTYPANLNIAATNIDVKNNSITNFSKDGIYFHYSENSRISGNKIKTAIRSGINLGKTKNITVNDNEISKTGTYGVYINETAQSNSVSLNTISDCTNGVLVKNSADNTISENTVKTCSNYGMYVYNTTEANTLTKNNISDCLLGVVLQKSLNTEVLENTISATPSIGVKVYSSSTDNTISGNIISENEYGVYSHFATNTVVKENSVTKSTVYGVNIHGGNKATIKDNEISDCTTNPIRVNYGADRVEILGNTINHSAKDSIYVNGSNDADKSYEKFVSIHDNIINSPADKACISGAFGNVAIQAYSNMFNGIVDEGKEPLPNYMRFKGDTSEYTRVYDELVISDLSLETFDDHNHLEWDSPYKNMAYRVGTVNEDGKIEQLAVTNNKSFDHSFSSDSDRDYAVKYWVAPIISFEDVKYVGMSLSIDYVPVIPETTATENTTAEETDSTTATETTTESVEATDEVTTEAATEPETVPDTTAEQTTESTEATE